MKNAREMHLGYAKTLEIESCPTIIWHKVCFSIAQIEQERNKAIFTSEAGKQMEGIKWLKRPEKY